MMYPFLTMNDHTEIVYSHLLDGAGVKIYVEKPDEYDGFHHVFFPAAAGRILSASVTQKFRNTKR